MPRPMKPPRLMLRIDRDGKRRWIIRFRGRDTRLPLLEDQEDEAQAMLVEFISGNFISKYRSDQGLIYFITCVASQTYPIKIGYSATGIAQRMNSIQIGNPNLLTAVGTMPGSIQDEVELHEKFRHHHIRGEWYVRSAELVEYIGGLPGQQIVYGLDAL